MIGNGQRRRHAGNTPADDQGALDDCNACNRLRLQPLEFRNTHLQRRDKISGFGILVFNFRMQTALRGLCSYRPETACRIRLHHFNQRRIQSRLPGKFLQPALINMGQAGTDHQPVGFAGCRQLQQVLPSLSRADLFHKLNLLHQRVGFKRFSNF